MVSAEFGAATGLECAPTTKGVLVRAATWEALAAKFKSAGQAFVIEPHIRFRGQPGEQATMFFLDPFGNALEFKAFAEPDRLFAK